jgi:hypothetical protein
LADRPPAASPIKKNSKRLIRNGRKGVQSKRYLLQTKEAVMKVLMVITSALTAAFVKLPVCATAAKCLI